MPPERMEEDEPEGEELVEPMLPEPAEALEDIVEESGEDGPPATKDRKRLSRKKAVVQGSPEPTHPPDEEEPDLPPDGEPVE